MAGHILVNFQTISQASSDVRGGAQRIRQQLDDLESAVKKVSATWEGSAQEGYQAKQREPAQEGDRLFCAVAKRG